MKEIGLKAANASLQTLGLNAQTAYWNLSPAQLVEHALRRNEGSLTDTGALAVSTGEFTGRSPKDRFIVLDDITKDAVWWNKINMPFEALKFDQLFQKMANYIADKQVFVNDCTACADDDYKLNVRVITEFAFSSLFADNMFIRPTHDQILKTENPDWVVLNCPNFKADAQQDGTRQHNFAIINFTKKMIIIGGTAYTGEIKKGIFSVLNFILPHQRHTLSMHCSANVGKQGDTAIFFGLSGTGKTTLSADPDRNLIGDDEHGWSENGVFNFEGGCYAKCIDLTEEKEPDIFKAVKFGAIVENTTFFPDTRTVNYADGSITENTRVSYPIHYINNAIEPSVAGHPKNIFFLAADASGILPPIARLNAAQAMFYFISGYTSKVAGTEMGIVEPEPTFSPGFGEAFLPLHPTTYAELLGKQLKAHKAQVWLINTGWSGGAYGVGSRMKLKYTRAMITAALEGQLDQVEFEKHPIFSIEMPVSCPNVPTELLNPRNTWVNKTEYDQKANELAMAFNKNFELYKDLANDEILSAAPQILEIA